MNESRYCLSDAEAVNKLQRELAAMVAHDDHGQLSKYELAAGLEDKGISLNNRELGEVFRHFDADHSGAVTYAEFITGVRGTMSGLRRAQVDVTYDFLERQGATRYVLDLRGSVEYWGSRCGICNGGDWRSLDKDAVVGDVPAAVVDTEDEFYQCGVCGQIFWPGRKYDDKMNGLKNLALNDDEDARLLKDAVHKFRVSPPPR